MRCKPARPFPTAWPQGPACRPLSRPPPHKPTHKGPRSHPHVTRMQMCCAVAGEIGLTQARGPACQQGSGSIRSRTRGAWESADHWAWCSEGRQDSSGRMTPPRWPFPSPLTQAAPSHHRPRSLATHSSWWHPLAGQPEASPFLAPHTEKGQEGQAIGAGQGRTHMYGERGQRRERQMPGSCSRESGAKRLKGGQRLTA